MRFNKLRFNSHTKEKDIEVQSPLDIVVLFMERFISTEISERRINIKVIERLPTISVR